MSSQTFDLNAGALAPVSDEVSLSQGDITVEGEIPQELNGTLVRNGPNPRSGRFSGGSMLDWWVGDGMVHGLRIAEGQVRWYRNRWHGHLAGGDRPSIPRAEGTRNVNVVGFGGRILALGEGEVPLALSPELDAAAPTTFGGELPTGMQAHPKLDPRTDTLRYFRADWQPPFLEVGSIDRDHRLIERRSVAVDRPVMMHDFAITEHYDIVLHLNVMLELDLLGRGARLPLSWNPDHQARVGIVGRDGSAVRWFEIERCFIQHVVNAFEAGGDEGPIHGAGGNATVVLDAVRYSEFLRFDPATGTHAENPLGLLWRFEFDLHSGAVTERQLDDQPIELPRIDERMTGADYRHLYAVEQPSNVEMRGVRRYDLATGATTSFRPPPGDQNSEPVFVPAGPAEGDGWILSCVYRAATDTSEVVILPAGDLSAGPVACVRLPRRIPAGFHGAWIPTE
jgi:carotenoid cleavage dioxygenase